MSYKILVCQNKTCKQQGSAQILKAFQRYQQRYELPETWVEPSGCLGQCGSGPMVLAIAEETEAKTQAWHSGVQEKDVWQIARRYSGLTSSSTEPKNSSQRGRAIWLWVSCAGLAIFFVVCIAVAVFAARHSHYV